ncbi:helix-turn-helix domain-containing protein [Chryseobacterium sp. MFBS3-17]|uniref:helix-turn-helix domain-containing protein n=1 Tax=Chryseobacterium sp. MFBS3-17 TaxID=2886689 RepID=UPI001D0EDDF2|nr:AraC family transcriptional regulator [Chryseobacterium sp. MFBS3-17]MCC2590312.1 AraC family transcriptional regulator [Chryseobacterium sp. MFBS3-17]
MTLYPIILFEKTITRVLRHYCDLCNISEEKSYLDEKILLKHTKVIINEYINLFKEIGFFDKTYEYYQYHYEYAYTLNNSESFEDSPYEEILKLIDHFYLQKEELENEHLHFIPIHLKQVEYNEILLYFGLVKKNQEVLKISILFHKTHFPKVNPKLGKDKFKRIVRMLKDYEEIENTCSLRSFAKNQGISYQNLQSESKTVFGTTFYKSYQKMKMIAVLEDFLLSDLSYKEIAYKNGFRNYNHMYILFHRTYAIPLSEIPRILLQK